ncbi:hypothetical protein CH63R_00938 [Colletotrichum higginsianum IMI 349063]|uniref:Uncharacterized protein n=1 Tax=Colletotrichum higginsianum (strain IMI 349063) TaxID=759273 RepID=A0A1B7YV50_COLHI|nr:hypothetical protein CH63R_00938 [Colletotrichum higginsianum IMI 349063]OBR15758.1 hypothetical protein CH63R_00938 [Colletotrichum higginsianum IMI 349063]
MPARFAFDPSVIQLRSVLSKWMALKARHRIIEPSSLWRCAWAEEFTNHEGVAEATSFKSCPVNPIWRAKR